jgi:hypothetical protein
MVLRHLSDRRVGSRDDFDHLGKRRVGEIWACGAGAMITQLFEP